MLQRKRGEGYRVLVKAVRVPQAACNVDLHAARREPRDLSRSLARRGGKAVGILAAEGLQTPQNNGGTESRAGRKGARVRCG